MRDIRQATSEDCAALYALYKQIGIKDDGYFEDVLGRGHVILMIFDNGTFCGYCIYNRTPKYSLYARLGIPEIQDLNVAPQHRRKGHAAALIDAGESMARGQGCETIGISVGLFKDYGPAQRLYAKLGYIPDGNGIAYDRQGVTPYQSYPVDDDLCLYMVKKL